MIEECGYDSNENIAKYNGEDEYYGPWFTCPYCKNDDIIRSSEYCNNCGRRIELEEIR